MSGRKIIEGLKQAQAGNFSRVTIEGQTWVRRDDPLTVAAPDLLGALKRLLEKFEVCAALHGNDEDVIADATDFARAAIAKATGGGLAS